MAPIGTTNNIATIEPVQWPRVTIGKQTLEVKWGILSSVMLSQWGLPSSELLASIYDFSPSVPAVMAVEDGVEVIKSPAVEGRAKDPKYQLHMCELFAACVAHNYARIGQIPPTAMHWAAEIDDAPDGTWNEVRNAIYAALGKKKPTKTPQTLPASATADQSPVVQ